MVNLAPASVRKVGPTYNLPIAVGVLLMQSLIPPKGLDEALVVGELSLEATRVYSVADALPPEMMIRTRPFRSPHHTISHAGLVGGGNWPHPGEISLAHRGVLFLEELPEFSTRVLEVMCQPIEDKVVTISRAQGSLTFPVNFVLVAAMNPCPRGYYGDPIKPCTCAPSIITKYQKQISGPLLDRIDIHIEVPRVDYQKLSSDRLGKSSDAIRKRVPSARDARLLDLHALILKKQNTNLRTLFPMPICVWRRFASSANWMKQVKV